MNSSTSRWFFSLLLFVCGSFSAFGYNPDTFAARATAHSQEQSRFYLGEFDKDSDELFITYVDAGPVDGAVVLLVHGVPTSSWAYRKVSANLAALGYRVIAPDNLGFGNSAKPAGKEIYAMERQAERLLALTESSFFTRPNRTYE